MLVTEVHAIQWYMDGYKTTEGTGVGVPRTRYSKRIFREKIQAIIENFIQFNIRETMANKRLFQNYLYLFNNSTNNEFLVHLKISVLNLTSNLLSVSILKR